MTRRATFTEAEIKRAIKAAKGAGMTVTRCEISPDGKIVLSEAPAESADNPFDAWKAKRESGTPRRS